MDQAKYKCFACGRAIQRAEPLIADTRDGQIVYIGPECLKRVLAAGEQGWTPPLGGPALYPYQGERV